MRPNNTLPSSTTSSNRRANGPPRASGNRFRLHTQVCTVWSALCQWFEANFSVPKWLSSCWALPWVPYLLAGLVEISAAGLTLMVLGPLPLFALQGSLLLLGMVVVALTWGAGPGLVATLVGTALLQVLVVPAYAARLLQGMADSRSGVVALVVGCTVSLIASQSGRARRQAQALAHGLRAEKARSDMEHERLRTLLEVLPAAVGVVDTQGHILERNQASKAVWGNEFFPCELAQLQAHQGWWPGTGIPVAVEDWTIARALRTGETILNEEVEELVEGKHKVILHSAAPIRDAMGTIRGAVGVLQDITEHKRLERELAERAAQLGAILESIADGLIVTDAQGRLLHLNLAYRMLLGLAVDPKGVTLPTLQELAGHAVLNVQGDPITEAERPVNRILQGEVLTGATDDDLLLRTPAGREVQVNVSGAPIRDPAGHLLGAVQVLRDVTVQRRMEQHIRVALDALLAMAEALVQAPECSLTASRCTVVEEHPVARRLAELTCRVLGFEHVSMAAVAPGTGVLTPITVVDRSREQEQDWWAGWDRPRTLGEDLSPQSIAALQAGEPVLLEHQDPSVGGIEERSLGRISLLVPMQVRQTLVGVLRLDGEASVEVSTGQNRSALISTFARMGALVLERERLLCEREEAHASELALRETQTQMETFLGIAGHELKTPLTSMKLSLQVAERRMRRLVQRETVVAIDLAPSLDHLAQSLRQVARLDRLVNELLDVSRVRVGKLDLHLEPADLAAIVREAVEQQRQLNPEHTLLLDLPTDLTLPVVVDADRLGQVVTNYLTNALKYSPTYCPVTVGLDVDARQAKVWVHDEGPGLPPEEHERIWERFHRVKGIEVQSGSGIGLGLGLYICRTIIERHQGQVGVESELGQGSTFWFTVPLAPVTER